MQVEVLKRSRLNGRDVEVGEVIEIDDGLAEAWFRGGRARKMSLPGKTPKEKIQLKALDVYNLELLVGQTVKTLQRLALRHGIEAPKKAGKQELIDLLMDAKASEGPGEEGPEEKAQNKQKEEGLLNMSMKKLLQLARIEGIKTTNKTTRRQLIDLLMEVKEDEGTGEEDSDEEKKKPGKTGGENPTSSD